MPGLLMGPGSAKATCAFITQGLRRQSPHHASPTSLAPPGSTMKPFQGKISSVKSVFPGVPRLSQQGSGTLCTMELKPQCPIFFAGVCCDQGEGRGPSGLTTQTPPPTPHQGQLPKESELPVTADETSLGDQLSCHFELLRLDVKFFVPLPPD